MKQCESRLKLLRTAHELIWRQSYGSVGVDQICEQSGVKKGSFYHFFRSKSERALRAGWPIARVSLRFAWVRVEHTGRKYPKDGSTDQRREVSLLGSYASRWYRARRHPSQRPADSRTRVALISGWDRTRS